MKKLLPKKNVIWDAKSSYTFQPYFVEQKARTSDSDANAVEIIRAEK